MEELKVGKWTEKNTVDDNDRHKTLPSMTLEELAECLELDKDKLNDNLSEAIKMAYEFAYDESLPDENVYLNVSKGDLKEVIRKMSLNVNDSDDGVLIKATKSQFNSMLDQATFGTSGVFLKLLTSGFSVKLKPMSSMDRVKLEYVIANSIIGINRLLSGDIMSAVYAKVIKEVIPFFLNQIEYTTVDYRGNKNKLLKLIKDMDIPLILLAMLKLTYPDGYDRFRYLCANKIKDETNTESICGHTTDLITIDFDELIFTTYEFTTKEIEQLNIREKNKLTEKQVLEYQENLSYLQPVDVIVEDTTFTLASGSVDNYLTKSNQWLDESIISSDIFEMGVIENTIRLIEHSSVGKYYYLFSKVRNKSFIFDGKDIDLANIHTLSSNEGLAEAIIDGAKKLIRKSPYVIGIPKYNCPSCVTRIENNEITVEDGVVSEINIIDLFTYLA